MAIAHAQTLAQTAPPPVAIPPVADPVTPLGLQQQIETLRGTLATVQAQLDAVAAQAAAVPVPLTEAAHAGLPFVVTGLTVFVLACFVGYYVVWRVTPALHSPLMAVTNAVSSVIIVGALIAAGPSGFDFSKFMGFLAVILAAVNIFGGFIVTQRMLSMFKKKQRT